MTRNSLPLSGKYASSPALHLRIGESRLRAVLYGGLCVLTGQALWEICARGYWITSLIVLPPAVMLLWRLRCDTASGALLCWQNGVWMLEQHGVRRAIEPLARCTVTPWAIYLAFTDLSAGCTGSLWLYVDSAAPAQWRQLRVRLLLRQ